MNPGAHIETAFPPACGSVGELLLKRSALCSLLCWATAGHQPHYFSWWQCPHAGLQQYRHAHKCSLACLRQLPLWHYTHLREFLATLNVGWIIIMDIILCSLVVDYKSKLLDSRVIAEYFNIYKWVSDVLSFKTGVFVFKDTTLALWFPCTLLSAMESGLSVWCFIVGLILRGIGPCAHTYLREQVSRTYSHQITIIGNIWDL